MCQRLTSGVTPQPAHVTSDRNCSKHRSNSDSWTCEKPGTFLLELHSESTEWGRLRNVFLATVLR